MWKNTTLIFSVGDMGAIAVVFRLFHKCYILGGSVHTSTTMKLVDYWSETY